MLEINKAVFTMLAAAVVARPHSLNGLYGQRNNYTKTSKFWLKLWGIACQPILLRSDKLKINPSKETRNAAIMLQENALETIITFNYSKLVCYSKCFENFPCIFYRSCVMFN